MSSSQATHSPKSAPYAVTSLGMWRQRKVLSAVLGRRLKLWPYCDADAIAAFVGWGGRPSAKRAQALASRMGKAVVRLEDGFLRSITPGRLEPSHSYVIDRTGIYFDRTGQSDLFGLIEKNDFTEEELDRAIRCMSSLRRLQLSKYNDGGALPDWFCDKIADEPIVLVVDQVVSDASIPADLDMADVCARMLRAAASEYAGKRIVVRPHPANRSHGPLQRAAAEIGVIQSPKCNPWHLLERADVVYTVSSHLGFEALMAGKQVVTYGAPFYAGWGLTDDRYERIPAGPSRSVLQLFAAAYLRYSTYYDPVSGTVCDLETAIERLRQLRDNRPVK